MRIVFSSLPSGTADILAGAEAVAAPFGASGAVEHRPGPKRPSRPRQRPAHCRKAHTSGGDSQIINPAKGGRNHAPHPDHAFGITSAHGGSQPPGLWPGCNAARSLAQAKPGTASGVMAAAMSSSRRLSFACRAIRSKPRSLLEATRSWTSSGSVEGVGDQVQRPAMVRALGQCHQRSGAQRTFPTTAARYPEPFLAIDPQQLLVVRRQALPRQQVAQTPIAEPPPLGSQLSQPLPKAGIVRPGWLISRHAPGNADQITRPTLAQPMAIPGMSDRTSLRAGRHHFLPRYPSAP